jgi:ActR/RegA family two-component response regulator
VISERAIEIIERTRSAYADQSTAELEATPPVQTLREAIAAHIRHVVALCGGNLSSAAKLLGIYRSSLQRRLRAMGDR